MRKSRPEDDAHPAVRSHELRSDARGIREIYLTGTAPVSPDSCAPAAEVFRAIASSLVANRGLIFAERVFGPAALLPLLAGIRRGEYGPLDDGVEPAWLASDFGVGGSSCAILVHALAGAEDISLIRADRRALGRSVAVAGQRFTALSALSVPDAGSAPEQAAAALRLAATALRQSGSGVQSIVRTWFWLRDILAWYAPFNAVRTDFYRGQEVLPPGEHPWRVPASTGVGIGAAGAGACALDLIAVDSPARPAECFASIGNQRCPVAYGSAFSRAVRAPSPAGETTFVSGTAAVDADGLTVDVGDPAAQIHATLDNVRAVLRDLSCRDEEVVQSVVYCKSAEVEREFHRTVPAYPWPGIVVRGDICRSDLLFEVEVTACRGARRAVLPT
jgi:enamine deaminase RidA (YjgF/YER057c/UK114 family)